MLRKILSIVIACVLCAGCLTCGYSCSSKNNFPVLPDEAPEAVVLTNLLGDKFTADEETIEKLTEIINSIEYIEVDDEELVGGFFIAEFDYSDYKICYYSCNENYVSVSINDGDMVQYRIDDEAGLALNYYLADRVQSLLDSSS